MTTNSQPDALAGKSCKSCNGFGYYVTAPSTASLGGEKIPCGACQPQFSVSFRTAEAAWSEEDNRAYLEWLGCAEGWPNDKRLPLFRARYAREKAPRATPAPSSAQGSEGDQRDRELAFDIVEGILLDRPGKHDVDAAAAIIARHRLATPPTDAAIVECHYPDQVVTDDRCPKCGLSHIDGPVCGIDPDADTPATNTYDDGTIVYRTYEDYCDD